MRKFTRDKINQKAAIIITRAYLSSINYLLRYC